MNKYRGFTLIETMLVIVVVITLLLVGHHQYQRMLENKRAQALQSSVLQAKTAVQRYYNTYCNDLVTDYVATNLPRSGLSTSGLTLRYNSVSQVKSGLSGLSLPYGLPKGITEPLRGEIKSDSTGEVTLYLSLWVPYTDESTLDTLQNSLGASSYGDSYPNVGGKLTEGALLIWSWPATQEAALVGNVRMGFGAAANAAFTKANTQSYRAIQIAHNESGMPVKLDKMPCQLVPAWLQVANTPR